MIVCIGDSITYGQKLQAGERPWTAMLNLDDKVLNKGVPGDTTRLGLERFPADVQSQPGHITVIQFGHNDCNRWQTDNGLPRVSPEAYRANLNEMIQRCEFFHTIPVLCTLTPSLKSHEHTQDVAVYDGILRSVAQVRGVPVIDARAAFNAVLDMWSLLMEDGLHLTQRGHEVYAEAARPLLGQLK